MATIEDLKQLENHNVQNLQLELLNKLYGLRDQLANEIPQAESSVSESDQVKELKNQNNRLLYRVEHLTRAVIGLQEYVQALKQENDQLKQRN